MREVNNIPEGNPFKSQKKSCGLRAAVTALGLGTLAAVAFIAASFRGDTSMSEDRVITGDSSRTGDLIDDGSFGWVPYIESSWSDDSGSLSADGSGF